MTDPAVRAVEYVLNDHGTPDTERCARQVLDALLDLGWRPPRTREHVPPPGAGGTVRAREEALEQCRQAVEAARLRRTTVKETAR